MNIKLILSSNREFEKARESNLEITALVSAYELDRIYDIFKHVFVQHGIDEQSARILLTLILRNARKNERIDIDWCARYLTYCKKENIPRDLDYDDFVIAEETIDGVEYVLLRK